MKDWKTALNHLRFFCFSATFFVKIKKDYLFHFVFFCQDDTEGHLAALEIIQYLMSKCKEEFSDVLTRDWIVNKVAAIAGSLGDRLMEQESSSSSSKEKLDKESSSVDVENDAKATGGTTVDCMKVCLIISDSKKFFIMRGTVVFFVFLLGRICLVEG